jgi:sugar lactone lactonase YvrE
LAFPPAGSRYGPDLFVTSFTEDNNNDPNANDYVYDVSSSGKVRPFADLPPQADPQDLAFPPEGSPFGDYLYVSSNNRPAIQRIDPEGHWSDFTSPGAMGEPNGIAFGHDAQFGDYLFVGNSTAPPADIVRVDPSGGTSPFVDAGYGPAGVAFGSGAAFGSNLYFADSFTGSHSVFTADPAGHVSTPFVRFDGKPNGLRFGRGGPFGTDLYVDVVQTDGSTSIDRVQPDGVATPFVSATTPTSSVGALEFSPDGTSLFISDYARGVIYRVTSAVAPPTISLDSPGDGSQLSANDAVLVTGHASADEPEAKVARVTVDGVPVGNC